MPGEPPGRLGIIYDRLIRRLAEDRLIPDDELARVETFAELASRISACHPR